MKILITKQFGTILPGTVISIHRFNERIRVLVETGYSSGNVYDNLYFRLLKIDSEDHVENEIRNQQIVHKLFIEYGESITEEKYILMLHNGYKLSDEYCAYK